MDCHEIRGLLADRSVGLLEEEALAAVDLHLGHCEGCRKEEARLAGVLAMVESLPMKEPPYGLWLGVEQRITALPAAPSWRARLGRRFVLGLATAAAAMMLVVGGVNRMSAPRPVAVGEGSAHVVQYASVGADQPFSDRVSLGSLAGVASDVATSD